MDSLVSRYLDASKCGSSFTLAIVLRFPLLVLCRASASICRHRSGDDPAHFLAIHAVTGTIVDAKFGDAATDGLRIAPMLRGLEAGNSPNDLGPSQSVAKAS